MAKINYAKAKTRDERRAAKHAALQRAAKAAPSPTQQIEMQGFVTSNRISCFKCGRNQYVLWSATGRQKTGKPWAICHPCATGVNTRRL